jgi:hypothetical protein
VAHAAALALNGSDVEASEIVNYALACRGMIAQASSHSATGRKALSCRQLLDQRLGLLQIERIKALGEQP